MHLQGKYVESMNLANILFKQIKQLAYNAVIVRFARTLGINNFLRDAYCRLFWPENRKMKVRFQGIEADFQVSDNIEMRYIEGNFVKGYLDERVVLKRLIQMLRPDDIAFDIGANIGIHSILMAKRIGEKGLVVAFEPDESNFAKLQFNIDLNSLRNLITVNLALGDRFTEAVLYHDSLTFGSVSGGQKVTVMPGDIVVKDKNLPVPNVVKIDVEGYEYYVIRGFEKILQEDKCEVVCCEIHPSMLPHGIAPDDVIDLLKSYGFDRIETYSRGETFHAFCCKPNVPAITRNRFVA